MRFSSVADVRGAAVSPPASRAARDTSRHSRASARSARAASTVSVHSTGSSQSTAPRDERPGASDDASSTAKPGSTRGSQRAVRTRYASTRQALTVRYFSKAPTLSSSVA